MAALVALAKAARSRPARGDVRGEQINVTEKRAALHTALRNFSGAPVLVDGQDVVPEVIGTRDRC